MARRKAPGKVKPKAKSRPNTEANNASRRRDRVAGAMDVQTATAEILRVIASSPGEPQRALDRIAETAARLFGAVSVAIRRVEGNAFRSVGAAGTGATEIRVAMPDTSLEGGSLIARAFREKRQLQRVSGDSAFEAEDAETQEILIRLEHLGIRVTVATPLIREGQAIGGLVIHRKGARPYGQKALALMASFADQAVIAIENARLLSELRESLDRQTATSEVLSTIASSPTEVSLSLDKICQAALRLFGAASVNVVQRDGDDVRATGAAGPAATYVRDEDPAIPMAGTLPGTAITERRLVQIVDLEDSADPARHMSNLRVDFLRRAGVRTLVAAPLMLEGEAIGALVVHRDHVKRFTDDELSLLQSFADQAVIAIENARLLDELNARNRDLAESLDHQTATSDILRAIASSHGEAERVLDAICETAVRMFAASNVGIRRLENGLLQYVGSAGRGLSEIRNAFPSVPVSRKTFFTRPVIDRIQIHVPDIQHPTSDADYDPENAELVSLSFRSGNRTCAFTPLIREGKGVGVMIVNRTELRPFTKKELELMASFADQAVIAIENARLLSELRESLEQQTATSEVLSAIAGSPGQLAPVFKAMLESATRICRADSGHLMRLEGADEYTMLASYDVSKPFDATLRHAAPTMRLSAGAWPMRMRRAKTSLHIVDCREDESYRAGLPLEVAAVEQGGILTALLVPLLKEGEVIGFFAVHRREVRAFAEKEIALIENFADQAVIAIENARLLSELRDSLEHQTASAEVLGVISASPGDLKPVFETMLANAMRICEAQCGFIYRVEAGEMHLMAESDLPPAYAEYRRSHSHSGGALSQMLKTLKPIHVHDARESEGYLTRNPDTVAGVELGGARTVLYVPMIRDGEIVGIINLFRREVRPFDANQLALLENFASQAVIAIENARLLDELRSRQAELRVTFDNMGDGVVMFDADLRLAAWNQNLQQILDLPDSFFAEPKSYRDYVTYMIERGEFSPERAAELAGLDESEIGEERFERIRPSGQTLEVRRNPVPGGGFVLIFSDITERKRAEEQVRAARDAAEHALSDLRLAQASLIQAEKMASLGQLTAGIAHEIKNPLNFVNNFAGLSVELLDEVRETAGPALAKLGEDKQAEIDELIATLTGNLEKIAEHGRRADGIVKSMLAHSRGGSGERQSVNLNALVEESLNLAYHGARAQDQTFNITMERDLDPSLTSIEVVPQELNRVFLNLFSNGFYAANKRQREDGPRFQPTLKVSTQDRHSDIVVRIRDNGIGIPSEHRAKLFEPFFTTKPTGEGTGLGLSISYEIVTQLHGGTIDVESEPGAFTEFTVTLPKRPGAKMAAENAKGDEVR